MIMLESGWLVASWPLPAALLASLVHVVDEGTIIDGSGIHPPGTQW
jgi:hypothetical protein